MYRVLARLDDGRVGSELFATYRGRVRFKGVVHLYFEGETFEHLIQAQFVEEVEKMRMNV